MKLIIIVLPIILCVLIGYMLGRYSNRTKPDMDRHERKELEARRDFMSDLGAKAAEHGMLGDNFAIIVQDLLRDERRKMQ